ncbi:pyruvoyl-dependent arginine decarboxylase [Thermodesulfobium sp.]|jgi:arginine decarboxylase|uniref:Pyruvoyl-dependent arginine decarboxylase AaxB n=1 Tax=Thermodesulfobium narugense TaxID=184064 RepID=A0A7C5KDE4_9BACT
MLPIPTKYFISFGNCNAEHALNAFDGALLSAGVGNTNLLRVSSILPPSAVEVKNLVLPYGALVPIAYASKISTNKGERIAAAAGIGIPEDPKLPGLIMEYSCCGSKEEAEKTVLEMVEEGFAMRGFKLLEKKAVATDIVVEKAACAFACVVLWY